MKPALEAEGEVFVYLQPFPRGADRLRFTVAGISAVPRQGPPIALSLSLQEFSIKEAGRQRLAASGVLPPGQYQGLSVTLKDAYYRSEEGEFALEVPDSPVPVEFPFQVRRKEAHVVAVELRTTGPAPSGGPFQPVFSAFIPDRPLPVLTGYVSNYGSNTVAVFDRKSKQVAGMLATGRGPAGMAIDEVRGRVYVALSREDAVEVIDVLSGAVINRVLLRGGDNPGEIAVTPDGRSVLVPNAGSNTVSVIDTTALVEVTRIRVGDGPRSVLIDKQGRKAYVFNRYAHTISVLDIPAGVVTATLSADTAPIRGDFSSRGDKLYVIHERTPYLLVFNTATLALTRREYIGMGLTSILVDPTTDLIYLGGKYETLVSVRHPFSFLAVGYIRAGGPVAHLAIDREENTLYMLVPGKRLLATANLFSMEGTSEIDVADAPYWVSVAGTKR